MNPALADAAELAKHLRNHLVQQPDVRSGSRQRGQPSYSKFDVDTTDGRRFLVLVMEL